MKIIPAIYILDGKCVALYKGNYGQKETYHKSPLQMAVSFEKKGAKSLYIVDLNGKVESKFVQKDIVREILGSVSVPIFIEAGFQTAEAIQEALDLGVSYVVLRTPDESFAKMAVSRFGTDKIYVQIYSSGSDLIEKVRTKPYATDVVDYAEKLVPLGVKKIIYKDKRSEGTLIHPNYDEVDRLFLIVGKDLEILVSGGVGENKHLIMLKKIGASGAIIGKALYEKLITIRGAEQTVK